MNKLKIVAFTLFFTSFLQAQDSSLTQNILYLNYKVFDELSIGVERKISSRFSISADIGYNFGGVERVYVDNGFFLYPKFIFLQLADKGALGNLNINLYIHKKHILSLNYFYRNLKSKSLIEDPGRYAGSGTSWYAEYDMYSSENGLLLTYSFVFTPSFLIYFGAGAQMAFIEKYYFITGSYSDKRPSNYVSKDKKYTPLIKIGCKLNLSKF